MRNKIKRSNFPQTHPFCRAQFPKQESAALFTFCAHRTGASDSHTDTGGGDESDISNWADWLEELEVSRFIKRARKVCVGPIHNGLVILRPMLFYCSRAQPRLDLLGIRSPPVRRALSSTFLSLAVYYIIIYRIRNALVRLVRKDGNWSSPGEHSWENGQKVEHAEEHSLARSRAVCARCESESRRNWLWPAPEAIVALWLFSA